MQNPLPANHWLRTRPIAHRGLHDISKGIPENSLIAFEKACKAGFPIELDVRISLDGKAIVFHDVTLLRLTKRRKTLSSQTSEQLKKISLLKTDQKIPTLDEALSVINGRVPVLIEIKRHILAGRLEDHVIDSLSNYKGDVAVLSFNPIAVRYLHEKNPSIVTGINIGKTEMNFFRTRMGNKIIKTFSSPQFVSYSIKGNVPKVSSDFYKKYNLPILAWVIKSQSEEEKARQFADNIIFESFLP